MPVPPMLLEDGDVAKVAELFLLLDSWDRKEASCRLCLIACNSSMGYFKPGPS